MWEVNCQANNPHSSYNTMNHSQILFIKRGMNGRPRISGIIDQHTCNGRPRISGIVDQHTCNHRPRIIDCDTWEGRQTHLDHRTGVGAGIPRMVNIFYILVFNYMHVVGTIARQEIK